MLASFPPMYRLTARGGVGLACDERGVALGPVPLVEALSGGDRRVFRPRPAEEIARTLALAYGPFAPQDLTRCLSGLDSAARALEGGDLVKASIAAVLLKLPELTPEAFAKLAADPSLKKYSPDQPRIPAGQTGGGQWTSSGGGGAGDRPVQVADAHQWTISDASGDLPARRGNNQIAARSFDRAEWQSMGEVDPDHPITIDAADQIAVETSSSAGPLPTNQFWFSVYTQPLEADGIPQPSISTPEWARPVEYGSGPTGGSRPNQFVIQANPPGPGMRRWTIKIPPQPDAHGNFDFTTVRVYVRKPPPAGMN